MAGRLLLKKYTLEIEAFTMKHVITQQHKQQLMRQINAQFKHPQSFTKASAIGVLFAFALVGCAGDNMLLKSKEPLISHVHYGHALTGWYDTPGKKGLFATAEDIANQIAKESVDLDTQMSQQADFDKQGALAVIQSISSKLDNEDESVYTLRRALGKATDHMLFAEESEDASSNMIGGALEFEKNAAAVLARESLLRQISQSVTETSSEAEIKKIVRQMRILSVQILEGVDSDSDGKIGSTVSEHGLRQLREQLAALAKSESPAYQPVARKYLFGLVRLPNGKWKFKDVGSGGGDYGNYTY